MAKAPVNYRLKDTFRVSGKGVGLKLTDMTRWHDRNFPGVAAISPHTWKAMREGGVVNFRAVQFLSRYLNRNSSAPPFDDGPYCVDEIAEPAACGTTADYRGLDLWKSSWRGLIDARKSWGRVLSTEWGTVPTDETHTRRLAEAVVRGAGRGVLGREAPEAELVEAAETLFKRPAAAVADWLLGVWRAQPEAVMQAVALAGDGTPAVCGVTVILPLTADAFVAFCRGELDVLSVGAAEMTQPSSDLVMFAVTDYAAAGLSLKAQRNAQLLAGMYQIAMLTPLLLRPRGRTPRLACPEAHRHNIQRSRTFGFAPLGTRALGLDLPVAVMDNPLAASRDLPPRPRGVERAVMYGAFFGTLTIVQSVHLRAYRRLTAERKRR